MKLVKKNAWQLSDYFANTSLPYPNSVLKANTSHVKRIYSIAIVAVLVFLALGIGFISYASSLSRKETVGYVQDATQQIKFAVEEHIAEEYDTLMAAAIVAQDRSLLLDDEVLRTLIDGLGDHNTYVQIGFADTNGQALWLDIHGREHHADLSAEGFFLRALSGENAFSNERFDTISNLSIHYYAVPIYDGKTDSIEGVLFAANPQDELRKIINNSLYAGKGLAHLIDENGDYIIKSDSPLVIGTGNNIFQIKKPLDGTTQQAIRDNLFAKRSGSLVKSFYGENRLVAYTPLAINNWNWHIFYVVPENMVSANLKSVTIGTIAMLVIATCIFIFFLILIHRLTDKSHLALEYLAFADPITKHQNFKKFLLDAQEVLAGANGANYAVCYCDIKGFAYINDLFGRDVGNRMLQYLADFQAKISQEGELAARVDGDTFVALRKYKSKQEIELRFEATARQLALVPETFASGYKAELYGGAYLLNGEEEALSLTDMLDRAITAQKEVKALGGAKRLGIFSKEMRAQKLWEAEVESTMEAALENQEFSVYWQPKIDIQHKNKLFGAEALVRWHSPEKGIVPPGRFIELFEQNGFILKLDKFVFESVCKFYKENILDAGLPMVPLSVNISRLAILQPDFIYTYRQIKNAYSIPDYCIELEFTESLVFGDNDLFKTVVADCKHNGFLCAMDDFGAGYSSLNMLKSLYVDVLKIDREFFLFDKEGDAARGQALIQTIIDMAKALGMQTVAEGIEEEPQVEQLRIAGCDAVQGYVFAKPMPNGEFIAFLNAHIEK